MNCNLIAFERARHKCRRIRPSAPLILLVWCATLMCSMTTFAQTANGTISSASPDEILVTQIMGFEGTPRNAKGKLSLQGDTLQFEKKKAAAARVEIASIDNVVLGAESKQLGGVPMTVGKAAAPYGGGRVVSLFYHKKFDTLTVEYRDPNGAFHGAIFELEKGQGQAFKDRLVAKGAHVTQMENQSMKQNHSEVQSESK